MASFITALMKQRKQAKKEGPDTSGRLKEILAVLRKYDYDDGLTPEITVSILSDLGPTFVKIGQIASQQAEYIPKEYCDALASLRSKVAPMDFETVNAQIEKYLGKPISELFASFNEKPLGSASIAQVHKAELFDGTVVAVKVRRPGIVDTVARDFALIEKILDKFVKGNVGSVDVRGLVSELETISKTELDLTNEADNLDRFWNNNSGREKVESPKCYRELTCEAVLTESFVKGTEASDTDFLETLGEDERERIAALVADNFASQVLVDGFYHADPHSGNVLIKAPVPAQSVQPEADGAEQAEPARQEDKIPLPEHGIEWIDFGMMGVLTKKQRQILLDLVTNVVMNNAYALKRTVMQVAQPEGEINHGALLEVCEDMCGQFNGGDFGDFDLGDLMGTIIDMLQKENYKIDPFITNLSRGIIAVSGTVKTISDKVNILNFFTDKIGGGLSLEDLDADKLKEMNPEVAMKLLQLANGIIDSASKTAETLDMLQKGQIKLHTESSIEEKTVDTVSRLASYAIRAFIIVAILIGSCLLCTVSPIKGDVVILIYVLRGAGIIGFITGLFFAQRLVRNMKSKK